MNRRRFKVFLISAVIIFTLTSTLNVLVAADNNVNPKLIVRALPRLVDVGADQCIPCKMMAPVIEELKTEYAGSLEVVFVDVWKKPEEGKKYQVRGIPTQIFYDASGKELYRHAGFMSKEDILKKLAELNIPVRKAQKK